MSKEFSELLEIVKRVRNECPWDKEQTHNSLKPSVIEEAYEVTEAIDKKRNLKEELGDLLLQVLMLAEIAPSFDIKDVIQVLKNKLIKGHPHVFGKTKLSSKEEVLERWHKRKKGHLLDRVPKALPALMEAYIIQERASTIGFDWNNIDGVFNKLEEELQELKEAKTKDRREEELGDLLFVIAHLGQFLDINPEDALKRACTKFRNRFRKIEKELKKNKSLSFEEMDKIWEKGKKKT
ncbi:MAG TPA: nucleoside triphosphate pyrophosphohydrolase [bacterium (Candidatus Stahlbacteria)]|nr:nucleoside triphosphate pyrophosphohydrolase [Candidatus Stahlbacteria bacterium]